MVTDEYGQAAHSTIRITRPFAGVLKRDRVDCKKPYRWPSGAMSNPVDVACCNRWDSATICAATTDGTSARQESINRQEPCQPADIPRFIQTVRSSYASDQAILKEANQGSNS